ncbi:Sensor histidine kinase BtsS [Paraconexibacter sp. AEG42_29]|uniref:Sensor histidine kinase BtsS n=1 Tax=Paraconexibacter sp. AEG42_29 TaxID=2997339 RepID=A0AAU7AQX5_9ACTN
MIGFALALVVVASGVAVYRLVSGPRRVLSPEGRAGQAALHAAVATLPHLRHGLTAETAGEAAPWLRMLVDAPALALCDRSGVLAFVGDGAGHHHTGDTSLLGIPVSPPDRLRIEPHIACMEPSCPLAAAVVAPILIGEEAVGTLLVFYRSGGRVRAEETRVVQECAALVGAQVALAELALQQSRLAEAELRALRAQISPHFIYNALAAIAAHIHSDPEEARELLTDFADFTRYLFRAQRPYVTLADELTYVEKYLRLEQARFGDRLTVRIEVAPEVLQAVVPVLSLQPLVENAVRHGFEAHGGSGTLEILGRDLGADVEVRVRDDGPGVGDPDGALAGRSGGIGLANVQQRLRQSFGAGYGLRIETGSGGTDVVMSLPKYRAGVRAA